LKFLAMKMLLLSMIKVVNKNRNPLASR